MKIQNRCGETEKGCPPTKCDDDLSHVRLLERISSSVAELFKRFRPELTFTASDVRLTRDGSRQQEARSETERTLFPLKGECQ
jgi:hypothetical protein